MAAPGQDHIGFASLLRLRWGVVGTELAAVWAASYGLELELPTSFLLGMIGFTAASNLLLTLQRRQEQAPAALIGSVLALDTLVLTGLLYASGGSANPFSILYLVYVTLAALILGARWTWSITALSSLCYGALFFVQRPLPGSNEHAHHGFSAHLQGMWLAFALSSALIAYFVGRLSRAVRDKEAELLRVQQQAARNERLAALTTLAAGAAHELNTPLSTVAVVAKEIERRVAAMADDEAHQGLAADARLIRAELERCRAILDQMSARAGESVGEIASELSLDKLVAETKESLGQDRSARLLVDRRGEAASLMAPPRALARILSSLLKNAFDASPPDGQVRLGIELSANSVRFVVEDKGVGMSPEVQARAVEPFFTTKAAGKGMGLGLFLVQSFADRLLGKFELESQPGVGTKATLELPHARS